MRIANLNKWKETFENNYPIKIDYFIYNSKLNQYECEWLESDKYCEINEVEQADGIGKCIGRTIKDIEEYLDGSYDKADLYLY